MYALMVYLRFTDKYTAEVVNREAIIRARISRALKTEDGKVDVALYEKSTPHIVQVPMDTLAFVEAKNKSLRDIPELLEVAVSLAPEFSEDEVDVLIDDTQ